MYSLLIKMGGEINKEDPNFFGEFFCYICMDIFQGGGADMENIIKFASAAGVKFESLCKILALNIGCFVKNAVFLMFLCRFLKHLPA